MQHFIKCRYAECRTLFTMPECLYAKCRCAQCRCAEQITEVKIQQLKLSNCGIWLEGLTRQNETKHKILLLEKSLVLDGGLLVMALMKSLAIISLILCFNDSERYEPLTLFVLKYDPYSVSLTFY
jgi:hypothetical protein